MKKLVGIAALGVALAGCTDAVQVGTCAGYLMSANKAREVETVLRLADDRVQASMHATDFLRRLGRSESKLDAYGNDLRGTWSCRLIGHMPVLGL